MITVENGEIWCGVIDSTLVRMVGAEDKGPIRGPRTCALHSEGIGCEVCRPRQANPTTATS